MAYEQVNNEWPDTMPVPTDAEAIAAVRRLYRKAMGKKWRGTFKITTGNRYTWPKGREYRVNAKGHHFGGWRDLVHDVSHYAAFQLFPNAKPHSHQHHFLERTLVQYAVKSGWLEGKLQPRTRPSKPSIDLRQAKIERLEARATVWDAKARRATRALAKVNRQLARARRALTSS